MTYPCRIPSCKNHRPHSQTGEPVRGLCRAHSDRVQSFGSPLGDIPIGVRRNPDLVLRPHQVRYGPLIDHIDTRWGHLTTGEQEAKAGINRTTLNKWRKNPDKTMTLFRADKYACSLDRHPIEIWGEEWLPEILRMENAS